jgi:streptomycin 6-kinase
VDIPERLRKRWRDSPAGRAWLDRLPAILDDVVERWSLVVERPFEGDDVTASWVAPARQSDGTAAVLKVGLPHMEAEHEIEGLRFWDGDPTVRLLESDAEMNAMLLERCEPGGTLRTIPEEEQDVVVAGLLRRLWRVPPPGRPFRPLSAMVQLWTAETRAHEQRWIDPGLVHAGLSTFDALLATPPAREVLLATDLHAGNVLAAQREPWLVIDPKPFVGDPAYDATQHLLNCQARVLQDPVGTIARFADLLEVDADRVRRWLFARAAAETHDEWEGDWVPLARALG